MKKTIVAVLAIASLAGCATVKKERAMQDYRHAVYIAAEDAYLNNTGPYTVGYKITEAIKALKDRIREIEGK